MALTAGIVESYNNEAQTQEHCFVPIVEQTIPVTPCSVGTAVTNSNARQTGQHQIGLSRQGCPYQDHS
jgi:hypothetical protein